MIRSAIWLLIVFAAAVAAALLLRDNHGNVSILWPPYRIDLSTNLAIVLAVIAFVVLYWLVRALSHTLGLPQRLAEFRERRSKLRANRALQGATLAWFEGRYDKAERLASIATEERATTPAAALIAARSAQRLGAPERRDSWLRKAIAADPGQAAPVAAEAEFACADCQPERALAAVDKLRTGGVEPRLALETSIGTWAQFGRWEQVLEAVRTQKGRKSKLSVAEVDALRLQAYEGLLAPALGDPAQILARWHSLRSDERRRRDLAVPTVVGLVRAGDSEEARRILVSVLDREYDDTLVEYYAAMEHIPGRARLEQLERWRNRYGDRPHLLEMLGRVCASEALWGKAETYLLQSVAVSDSVSARVGLAQLYDAIDRRDDASQQFQVAARLALGERPGLSLALEPKRSAARVSAIASSPVPSLPGGADDGRLPQVMALPSAAAAAGAIAADEDGDVSANVPRPIASPTDDHRVDDAGTADAGTADVGTADVGTADVGTAGAGSADAASGAAGLPAQAADPSTTPPATGATSSSPAAPPASANGAAADPVVPASVSSPAAFGGAGIAANGPPGADANLISPEDLPSHGTVNRPPPW